MEPGAETSFLIREKLKDFFFHQLGSGVTLVGFPLGFCWVNPGLDGFVCFFFHGFSDFEEGISRNYINGQKKRSGGMGPYFLKPRIRPTLCWKPVFLRHDSL